MELPHKADIAIWKGSLSKHLRKVIYPLDLARAKEMYAIFGKSCECMQGNRLRSH